MERIEYVSRMEDYAAWIQFELLYIRRMGLRMKLGALRHWIIIDLFFFTTLFIARIGWIYLSTVIALMVVIQLILVLGQNKSVRKGTLEEAQRAYSGRKEDMEPHVFWFDQDKVVDEGKYIRIEVRWERIQEMILSPDWSAIRFGAISSYIKRSSVITGDFERFAAEILKEYQEAKQRLGLESKYRFIEQKTNRDDGPIPVGR